MVNGHVEECLLHYFPILIFRTHSSLHKKKNAIQDWMKSYQLPNNKEIINKRKLSIRNKYDWVQWTDISYLLKVK